MNSHSLTSDNTIDPSSTKDTTSHLFCFFTGATRGLVTVEAVRINHELNTYWFNLSLNQDIQLQNSPYIQIDGVLCQIIEKKDNGSIVASTTFELIQNTTLKKVVPGDRVSLCVLAEYDPKDLQSFLIHPSANSMAKVESCSIQPGHQHTLKIDFSYDSKEVELEEDKHVGLSGSSLLVRELKKENGLQLFSIYAGRQTREKTRFNNSIKPGDLINITPAKLDKPIETAYPYEFKNPSKN